MIVDYTGSNWLILTKILWVKQHLYVNKLFFYLMLIFHGIGKLRESSSENGCATWLLDKKEEQHFPSFITYLKHVCNKD